MLLNTGCQFLFFFVGGEMVPRQVFIKFTFQQIEASTLLLGAQIQIDNYWSATTIIFLFVSVSFVFNVFTT